MTSFLAFAIFAMLVMMLGLPLSGLLIAQKNEAFEEVCDFFAYEMTLDVVVHIVGVVLHTIRHKENITASMVHGRKAAGPANAIISSRPIATMVSVCIVST